MGRRPAAWLFRRASEEEGYCRATGSRTSLDAARLVRLSTEETRHHEKTGEKARNLKWTGEESKNRQWPGISARNYQWSNEPARLFTSSRGHWMGETTGFGLELAGYYDGMAEESPMQCRHQNDGLDAGKQK